MSELIVRELIMTGVSGHSQFENPWARVAVSQLDDLAETIGSISDKEQQKGVLEACRRELGKLSDELSIRHSPEALPASLKPTLLSDAYESLTARVAQETYNQLVEGIRAVSDEREQGVLLLVARDRLGKLSDTIDARVAFTEAGEWQDLTQASMGSDRPETIYSPYEFIRVGNALEATNAVNEIRRHAITDFSEPSPLLFQEGDSVPLFMLSFGKVITDGEVIPLGHDLQVEDATFVIHMYDDGKYEQLFFTASAVKEFQALRADESNDWKVQVPLPE